MTTMKECSFEVDMTTELLALGGNHHGQVYQPFVWVRRPEALKAARTTGAKISAVRTRAAVRSCDGILEQVSDEVAVSPVGVVIADSASMPHHDR